MRTLPNRHRPKPSDNRKAMLGKLSTRRGIRVVRGNRGIRVVRGVRVVRGALGVLGWRELLRLLWRR